MVLHNLHRDIEMLDIREPLFVGRVVDVAEADHDGNAPASARRLMSFVRTAGFGQSRLVTSRRSAVHVARQ